MRLSAFHFKKFSVEQNGAAHPVGTDAVLLGSWADVRGAKRFLDIGTGTGVIALMLAQRIEVINSIASNSTGMAVEIHPASAALARNNFTASPWANQLDVWTGSVQEFASANKFLLPAEPSENWMHPDMTFDLIVSNPPFFSDLTVSLDKSRSLGRHTATLSPDDLLACVAQLLSPNGKFCTILPVREGYRLCEFAVPLGLYWTRITEVSSRSGKPVERLLLQFERSPFGFQKENICLYADEKGQEYSQAFQSMTRDFYL